MDKTECPHCSRVGLVRAEYVIKGVAAVVSFQCGGCSHTWEIADRRHAMKAPPIHGSRASDPRTRTRDVKTRP